MPLAAGTVEAVSVKPIPNPNAKEKEWGHTHRASIKIGEDWFSMGGKKDGEKTIFTKSGLIGVGAEVEFIYIENGDFKNVNRGSITVKKAADPIQSAPKKAYIKGSSDQYANGAQIGQCINLAVELGLAKSYEDLKKPATIQKAITHYKETKDLYSKAWDSAKGKPAEPVKVDLDNETPF